MFSTKRMMLWIFSPENEKQDINENPILAGSWQFPSNVEHMSRRLRIFYLLNINVFCDENKCELAWPTLRHR